VSGRWVKKNLHLGIRGHNLRRFSVGRVPISERYCGNPYL